MSNPLASFPEFDTLLAYAYDELPEDVTKQIAEKLQLDKRLALLVAGIRSVRQHQQFKTKAEHQAWISQGSSVARSRSYIISGGKSVGRRSVC